MEEVKLAIKPYYQKKDITKEEYKDILRKAVHKVGPRGEQVHRGGERSRRRGGHVQTDVTQTGSWEGCVCLEGEERDGIHSSPPGPGLLVAGLQVGLLAWNGGGAAPILVASCAQQSRWQRPRGSGSDRSCPSLPRSATAKAGRSTR